MKENQPTINTVTEGLAKLLREVRQLQREVAGLRSAVKGFTDSHNVDRMRVHLPPEAGGRGLESTAETAEPDSAIRDVRYEYSHVPNLEIPTRTLLAISKEIDGSLRDIRSAKLDIKAIADDSDLRDDFRRWQENQNRD